MGCANTREFGGFGTGNAGLGWLCGKEHCKEETQNEGRGFTPVQVTTEHWGGIYWGCLVAGGTSPEEGDLPGRGAQQLSKENKR